MSKIGPTPPPGSRKRFQEPLIARTASAGGTSRSSGTWRNHETTSQIIRPLCG